MHKIIVSVGLVFCSAVLAVANVAGSAFAAGGYAGYSLNLQPHSWDPGLYAVSSPYATGDNVQNLVHAWGRRTTSGAWGTGPVNYQSGATVGYRIPATWTYKDSNGITQTVDSNSISVTMSGTYCPNDVCSFGTGTGYKSIVQFWNDPNNYIAFGLIKDPGVSPNGTTLMIEGAADGKPVGGYWGDNQLPDSQYYMSFTWQNDGISVTIYKHVLTSALYYTTEKVATLGKYEMKMDNPSISFLAAGRNTGDIADSSFEVFYDGAGVQ